MTNGTLRSKLAAFAAILRGTGASKRPWEDIPVLTPDKIRPFFQKAFDAYDDWYYSIPENQRVQLPTFTIANSYLDKAAKASDIESLRAYAKFPELCNPWLALLIPILREVHRTAAISTIISKEHIAAYRRIRDVCAGQAIDTQLQEFAKLVLEDMDRSEAVLRIAEQRNIIAVADIKELLASAAIAPAIGDGAL